MKKLILFIPFFILFSFAQNGNPDPVYYNGFNWSLNGYDLKVALTDKITSTHTRFLVYTPDIWEASKLTDLVPEESSQSNVLLVYGYENTICSSSTSDFHRRRNKFSNGGGSSCEWNREHVYARSLGTPNLGTEGAGSDAHHLRPSDVDFNTERGNKKFAAGSGIAGTVNGNNWYPGDEWKGDIARMMMYMYLRYPNQCLATNVGIGNPVDTDIYMIDLFLQWNAEDPVSQLEDNRNLYHGNASNTYAQGNRNPFIDNPYLATKIWGGPIAQNRWAILDNDDFLKENLNVEVYPNPSNTGEVNISSVSNIEDLEVYNLNGQLIYAVKNPIFNNQILKISNLKQGIYWLSISNENKKITKKIAITN